MAGRVEIQEPTEKILGGLFCTPKSTMNKGGWGIRRPGPLQAALGGKEQARAVGLAGGTFAALNGAVFYSPGAWEVRLLRETPGRFLSDLSSLATWVLVHREGSQVGEESRLAQRVLLSSSFLQTIY